MTVTVMVGQLRLFTHGGNIQIIIEWIHFKVRQHILDLIGGKVNVLFGKISATLALL